MGLFSFFSNLFGKKSSSWNGSPEMFLAMVLSIQKKNSGVYSEIEVLQWGEVFQKVFKVKLFPYKDFKDLMLNGKPDFSLIEQIDEEMIDVQRRIELKKAIYGDDVDLGDDDVMTSNSESAIQARKIIDDLSKYVRFREDESDIKKDNMK
ncbi:MULTISPECIES: hypothetical protein [Sphingobacterium]|uniref:hypothetical protein n=1 Tax=Sphingobacterium TaxID=28453 RepID=UPI00257FDC58|nr:MULTISPECIES: hypothetical protein [Sphingobacterium]